MTPWTHLPVAAMLLTAGLGVATAPAHAEPKVVSVGRDHYTGTWLEIARTPMRITDGCVAGYTTYKPSASRDIYRIEDGCRMGSPKGELRTIDGIGKLEDAGTTNAKLTVRYLGGFVTFKYWVLYKSPDRSWFISADPQMKNLWIYARKAPSKKELAVMVAKAKSLGYDVSKLEYPEP
ncbi:lipocalin family protein [Rhizobium sp. C1]|uniref:lipocalin family protein n=1 Tax=Rhizobium sp. C1 TaxID=1349799 RepID=UPI001E34C79B|nr:lipocalin family protein [Rhizobium sp. C1]MCD2178716.1 lipocalin family protein [Rhizobium sp. C1]